MCKWLVASLVAVAVSGLTKHHSTNAAVVKHHVQRDDESWRNTSFAVGVNTGSGVMKARIPVLLRTWLSPYWNVSRLLILSDSADAKLHVTPVPMPFLCSKLGMASHKTLLEVNKDDEFSADDDANVLSADLFNGGWKVLKNSPYTSWRKQIAMYSFRCMQYRFLYIGEWPRGALHVLITRSIKTPDYYL
jgi:hypothetical protein